MCWQRRGRILFVMLVFLCSLYYIFMPLLFSAAILTGNVGQGVLIFYIWTIMQPIIWTIIGSFMGSKFFLIGEILEGDFERLWALLASILLVVGWYTAIPYCLWHLTLCYPTWWVCVIWWLWGTTPTIITVITEE